MNTAWVLQIVADVVLLLGVIVMWARLNRPAQDDPRLSRGLQLLQSKIAVLEDLSDRTDAQVKQLNSLIEQKSRLLQNKLIESEHQVRRIEQAMHKSKEVAEIFQDKIPHQEIIERQNTIKYVKAAKMANSGKTAEEIAAVVDLPMVQIELIAKLNKEQLVFDAEALPEWADKEETAPLGFDQEAIFEEPPVPAGGGDMATLFEPPKEEYSSLKRLGEEFRNACIEFEQTAPNAESAKAPEDPSALYEGAKKVTAKIVASASEFLQGTASRPNPPSLTTPPQPQKPSPVRTGTVVEVRKVEFPRVNVNQTLR